jgi:uncharacterized protein YnzC (UPF0291/DUF896 family)
MPPNRPPPRPPRSCGRKTVARNRSQTTHANIAPDIGLLYSGTWKNRDRNCALKRGGGQVHLSLDGEDDESHRALDPADDLTPERLYERQWACTVRVMIHRLRRRYREMLRAEVADTVASPRDVDDEIRHLLAAFR